MIRKPCCNRAFLLGRARPPGALSTERPASKIEAKIGLRITPINANKHEKALEKIDAESDAGNFTPSA
jgi:hypothetical protein